MENTEKTLFSGYDKICNTAMTNLFTISKETNAIELQAFNHKNLGHRALLTLVSLASECFTREVHLNTSIWNWIWIKMNYRHISWKRTKNKNFLSFDEFIEHIENAYDSPKIFNEIYNIYFKKG